MTRIKGLQISFSMLNLHRSICKSIFVTLISFTLWAHLENPEINPKPSKSNNFQNLKAEI